MQQLKSKFNIGQKVIKSRNDKMEQGVIVGKLLHNGHFLYSVNFIEDADNIKPTLIFESCLEEYILGNMIVYKLFRIKNNKLYPLFINRSKEVIPGEWLTAECFPTKGFAVRQGWHCTLAPIAPHLKTKLASGEKRVWVRCLAYDLEYYKRPESQGGTWVLAQHLKVLERLTD